jgi:hypothetical protein
MTCKKWGYKEQDENHSAVSLQTSLGFVVACLRVTLKSLSILDPNSPRPHALLVSWIDRTRLFSTPRVLKGLCACMLRLCCIRVFRGIRIWHTRLHWRNAVIKSSCQIDPLFVLSFLVVYKEINYRRSRQMADTIRQPTIEMSFFSVLRWSKKIYKFSQKRLVDCMHQARFMALDRR